MRVGQGFDAHRFGDAGGSSTIRLGGVDVPCQRGVIAHSDGDVLLHALCDALLGAAALGDIGQHFPDSELKYKGADSLVLLRECVNRVSDAGYRPLNADLTLIAQAPRIGIYRRSMVTAIAAVLGVDESSVNVKATTTEGMGFTGDGQGLAALAVVCLDPTES